MKMVKTQCVVCAVEVEVPQNYNGEPMCKEHYNDDDYQVFYEEGEENERA